MFSKTLTYVFVLTLLATPAWQVHTANAQEFGVQKGLVSYWTFDKADIDGTTVKDTVGENDGSMMGGTKSGKGKCNEALEFDGVDDRVLVADNPSLNSSTFSIEIWLKPVTIRPFQGQWPNIIMGREVYQNSGFRYRITAGGNIRFWTTESGGTIELGSAAVISTDSFYHIVTTYDNTEARMYIDGSLDGAKAGKYVVPVGINLSIVDGVGGTKPANVIIDEVRIYNRALSADEVKKNFEVGCRFGEEGITADNKLTGTWGKIKTSK